MTEPSKLQIETKTAWPGLGGWNFYFLAKLLLFQGGWINFHALPNAAFAAVLIIPLPWVWLRRVRQLAAVPAGVALLYYDTWFPPFSRLFARSDILDFSPEYLIELLGRFVNWELLAAGFVVLVVYWYLAQYVRFTTITVAILGGLLVLPHIQPAAWLGRALNFPLTQVVASSVEEGVAVALLDERPADVPGTGDITPAVAGTTRSQRPLTDQLDDYLHEFYAAEQKRQVDFSGAQLEGEPFDILFLHVCSLSWADLKASGLDQHPVLQRMNIVFRNFNSVSSYSGPATIRFLRASCGQATQSGLYEPVDDNCYLFSQLAKLGFVTDAVLNHDGEFEGFLGLLGSQPAKPEVFVPKSAAPALRSFDSSPIWGDYDTLSSWYHNREAINAPRLATHYNTITLHDGNREALANGQTRAAPFKDRAQRLLDELQRFLSDLEASGKPMMVVLVPEHGAAIEGDRMQISGMREIPTAAITHVPVGVYFIGSKSVPTPALEVDAPVSYLALAELVVRTTRADPFGEGQTDWAALVENLPQTLPVSENDGSVFMVYQDRPYVRMGERNWIDYPQ